MKVIHSWGIGDEGCMFTGVAKHMDCIPFKDKKYEIDDCEKKDYLVLDTMLELFNKSKNDEELKNNLNKKKISFLFHLNEIDTLGHTLGPKSDKLRNHFIAGDSYFEKLENAFNDFYKDNKTTFIITSDHGMNMNKVHGDGSSDCIKTPFIIWGSGIRKPIYKKNLQEKENVNNVLFKNYEIKEISQIDLTPLFAGLIDVNFPMNSLGIIPLDIVDASDKVKSKLLFSNFLEIFENYKIKNDLESKAIIFKPYKHLIDSNNQIKIVLDEIKKENYLKAINETQNLIKLTLRGIEYIHHYDRFYLKTTIAIGYIFWMFYLFIFIEMKNNNNLKYFFIYNSDGNTPILLISIILIIILYIYLFLRLSPFLYYLYTLFPCYFFWRILVNIKYIKTFFIKENEIKYFMKKIFLFALIKIVFLAIVSKRLKYYFLI